MGKFKYLQYLLHAAVLGGMIWAGVKYINGDAFVKAIRQFHWVYAIPILALSIGYVLVKGWRFVQMMQELENVSKSLLMRAYLAGQSCTLLPGGAAVRAALLGQVGIPAEETAAPMIISSLTDQFVFFACVVLAAIWYEEARKPLTFFIGGLVVLSVLLGVEAVRTWFLGVIEKLMGRFKILDHWKGFKESIKDLMTVPILVGGVGNAAVAILCHLGALYLTLRGLGVDGVPLRTILMAYALPTMLGRISALPGGFGVTEAGMVGILDQASGVSADQAAAATLLFRLGTIVFAALFGGVVYLFAWHGEKESAAAVGSAASEKATL